MAQGRKASAPWAVKVRAGDCTDDTLAFTPDSTSITVVAGDGIRGWDLRTGRQTLDLKAEGARANTVEAVATLERLVTQSPGLEGVVLRYGHFYGPGTGVESAAGKPSALHVDAAAYAALLAVDRGAPGIYNVAEPSWQITGDKVRRELGWDAAFRLRS
jgi:hypothetical protein